MRLARRLQRRYAFLIGSKCGPESCVSLLPPDLLRRIAEQAGQLMVEGRAVGMERLGDGCARACEWLQDCASSEDLLAEDLR